MKNGHSRAGDEFLIATTGSPVVFVFDSPARCGGEPFRPYIWRMLPVRESGACLLPEKPIRVHLSRQTPTATPERRSAMAAPRTPLSCLRLPISRSVAGIPRTYRLARTRRRYLPFVHLAALLRRLVP